MNNRIVSILLSILIIVGVAIAAQLFLINKNLTSLVVAQATAPAIEETKEDTKLTQGLCMRFDINEIESCAPGSKVVFLPQRWGNEQLPIYTVGMNCDLSKPIVQNNAGVVCTKEKAAKVKEEETQKDSETKSEEKVAK